MPKCPNCTAPVKEPDKERNFGRFRVKMYKCTKCGNIHFKYQALHGVVFVWPKPIKEMTDGGVLIPEFAQYNLKSSYGVVLSSGKGCKNRKTGKFVDSDLNIGDIILYDKSIPWKMNVEATDGKEYEVNLMNVLDIKRRIEWINGTMKYR